MLFIIETKNSRPDMLMRKYAIVPISLFILLLSGCISVEIIAKSPDSTGERQAQQVVPEEINAPSKVMVEEPVPHGDDQKIEISPKIEEKPEGTVQKDNIHHMDTPSEINKQISDLDVGIEKQNNGILDETVFHESDVHHKKPTKKSRSGICHAPDTTYYARTKNYQPYPNLRACLQSGGREPKR